MTKVYSTSLEDPSRLQKIEDIWNYYIGERYSKCIRWSDYVTVYTVPDRWANWWRFWLAEEIGA